MMVEPALQEHVPTGGTPTLGGAVEIVSQERALRRKVAGVDLEVLAGGAGEPMLVLHDYEYLNVWRPYLQCLAERFSVLVPSHPGFGTSELPQYFDTIQDLAYLYLDLVEEVCGEDRGEGEGRLAGGINLLGLGIGGWIAAEMAVRCSHHLRRLVLVDAVGIKVSGPTERDIADTFVIPPHELLRLAWHDSELGAERMKLPGVSALHTGGQQAAVAGAATALSEPELVALLRNRQSAALFTWKPFMHNPKLRARLRRVDVPTLVLWGESDRVVSPDYGRAYAQAIPGARFQTLPAAGHYPYLERPDEFVDAVTTFLSSDRPPTAHGRPPDMAMERHGEAATRRQEPSSADTHSPPSAVDGQRS